LWDWVQVAKWMFRNDKIKNSAVCTEARMVKAANAMLERGKSERMAERLVELV
jgi:hypothetical protein